MKGKFIKKLVAYALTAAMVVSTPMTAFATEFADNFWVSDGEADGNDTGTVSHTGTETTVLKDYWDNIEGIQIVGETSVIMEEGQTTELTAEVLYKEGKEPAQEVKDAINTQIRWRSTDSKVVTVDAKLGTMTVCPINAKNEGVAYVSAGLDVDNDGKDDFSSHETNTTVLVTVNKPSASVADPIYKVDWDYDALDATTFYANRVYDLNDYLMVYDGQSWRPYYDEDGYQNWESVLRVTYSTNADPKKQAKIIQVGEQYDNRASEQYSGLFISKALKTDAQISVYVKFVQEDPDNIYASLASDGSSDYVDSIDNELIEAKIKISRGVPAKKLTVDKKKGTADFGDLYNYDGDVDLDDLKEYEDYYDDNGELYPAFPVVVSTAPVDTTDIVTWSAKDRTVARVVNAVDNNGDPYALIVGLKPGKTTVTFTTTSGKKANVNVTVNATLKAIVNVEPVETWSGKTTDVSIERRPWQNTEKLKITIDPAYKKFIKVKNQSIVPVANLKTDRIDTTFTVSSNKKNSGVTPYEGVDLIVKQSDVHVTRVERVDGNPMEKPEKFRYLADTAPVDNDEWDEWYYNNEDLWSAYYTFYYVDNTDMDEADMWDAISWTSSNPSVARVVNGRVVATRKPGTAKITLSSVGKSGNGYKTYKVSFNVKCTPVCDEITLKSYDTANVRGKKATLSVKQLLPKKTVDSVKWYVEGVYDVNGDLKGMVENEVSSTKKLTYVIPSTIRTIDGESINVEAGDTIVVRVEAVEPGIAVKHANIHVLSTPTKKVQFTEADNKGRMTLAIGQLKLLSVDAGNGDVVTGYSVNKRGVVKVLMLNDRRAIVCGVGEGKVTVTAQMASGKKAKTTITVSKSIAE